MAVETKNITYKITMHYHFYFIKTKKEFWASINKAVLFSQQKKTKHILQLLCASFLFDFSQYFSAPNIIRHI
jgi:hypothetical protein